MKWLGNFILGLLALTVLDFSIIDSDGDRTKSIIFIHYSDDTEDRLVIDKSKLEDPYVLKAVDQIIDRRLRKKKTLRPSTFP